MQDVSGIIAWLRIFREEYVLGAMLLIRKAAIYLPINSINYVTRDRYPNLGRGILPIIARS